MRTPTLCRACGGPIPPATWRHLRDNPNLCFACEAAEAPDPGPAGDPSPPAPPEAFAGLNHQDQIRLLFNPTLSARGLAGPGTDAQGSLLPSAARPLCP